MTNNTFIVRCGEVALKGKAAAVPVFAVAVA